MKEKILIVDDSMDMQVLLGRILHAADYDVTVARSGEEALLNIKDINPDLILLDILMPGIDGYEVCKRLREMHPAVDAPVIFLSAKTDAADKVKGLEMGGADYITKPFDRAEVLARVANHLKIRRLTAELTNKNIELTKKQKNLDEDLRAAAGIQQSLLPRSIPYMENLSVAWKFMPSSMIGGDIFNVFRLDEDHVGIYMIDVSGHGAPSALVTVSVSQTLQPDNGYITKKRIYSPPGYEIPSPGMVLEALDREYPIERFDKYFTIVYMIINIRNGTLTYSNAAHPPPAILRQDGEPELLEKGGTIIGLGGLVPFEEEQKVLNDGDMVILYTDGIIDYCNEEGEYFGMDRFLSLLDRSKHSGLPELLDVMMESIDDFGKGKDSEDDITVVAIGYKT